MTPVTRNASASIHVADHTSRYDYLNAAKKNLRTTTEQQQSSYDEECFEDQDNGRDACISISTRTTRNSKVKQQQQQPTSKKTVAFAKQNKTQQEQAPPAQQQQQQHEEQHTTGKRISKRQAAKYDAHIDAVEAADILASITAAAAAAGPKERTPPYWTRQHEKAKAGARLQKAMSCVLRCDD